MGHSRLRILAASLLIAATLVLVPLSLLGAEAITDASVPARQPHRAGEAPSTVSAKVLVYDDDWVHTPTGPERALTALNIPYTMVGDPTAFETQLGLQEWDLVILANEYHGMGPGTLDALQAYLAASKDHKAIVETWEAGTYPTHPIWATLGISSPIALTTPTPLHWWGTSHPLFNQPNEVPEFTALTPFPGYTYGASATLAGPAGPGLGGFAGDPTAGQAGVVLSPDNRTIYKGLLDFCNDQDANENSKWDVQEWWENAIRTLYPRAWRVLFCYADPYGASQYLSQLALYPDTPAPATFNANAGTPTLDQLKTYDVVIVWSNSAFNDGGTLGDRLADYVDAGGRVVCAVFALGNGGSMAPGGRFVSGGYRPFDGVGGGASGDHTLGVYSASHRLMWGVSSFSGFFRQVVTPSAGSTLVASWNDGVPLLAAKGRVVAVNAYVGGASNNQTTGDVTALFHNAVAYLTSPRVLVVRAHSLTIGAQLSALRNIGDIALVDEFDAESASPTLDQLKAYDLVMAYSDSLFSNPAATGDALADFADQGGGVLLATFDWQGDGSDGGLAGRIADPTYSPFSFAGPSLYADASLGDFDRTHPLMQGVSELSAYYRDQVSLNPGATLVASWADGYGAVATQGRVSAINAYFGGAPSHLTAGDGTTLLHNAVCGLFYFNTLNWAEPLSGSADLPVTFHCTVNGGAPPYSFTWTFGDGSIVHEQNPSHIYTHEGNYGAHLSIEDSLGRWVTGKTITIEVGPHLEATPTATPTLGQTPLTVIFAANVSGGTPPYAYDWAFGDGSAHSASQNPSHTYGVAGLYTAVLTVTDAAAHTVTASPATVTVLAPLAVTFSAAPTSGSVPLAVSFTAAVSGGTGNHSLSMDYGDGSAPNGLLSHTYNTVGTFTATVTVTDDEPSLPPAIAHVTITVRPPPPVVTLMKKVSPPFTIVVTGSNLQNGIQVYINGTPWNSVKWKNAGKIKLTGGGALKALVPKGVPTTFRFVNPDTGETTTVWSY